MALPGFEPGISSCLKFCLSKKLGGLNEVYARHFGEAFLLSKKGSMRLVFYQAKLQRRGLVGI